MGSCSSIWSCDFVEERNYWEVVLFATELENHQDSVEKQNVSVDMDFKPVNTRIELWTRSVKTAAPCRHTV